MKFVTYYLDYRNEIKIQLVLYLETQNSGRFISQEPNRSILHTPSSLIVVQDIPINKLIIVLLILY